MEAELQESLRSCTSREMVEPIAAHIRELYVHREGMVEVRAGGSRDRSLVLFVLLYPADLLVTIYHAASSS